MAIKHTTHCNSFLSDEFLFLGPCICVLGAMFLPGSFLLKDIIV